MLERSLLQFGASRALPDQTAPSTVSCLLRQGNTKLLSYALKTEGREFLQNLINMAKIAICFFNAIQGKKLIITTTVLLLLSWRVFMILSHF